ncbi:MAG TPA: RsmB/NOP family class I SAM-dependent RNA methyltransferase [Anaerolineae bacterium]|nr:RsmB/NOP family class I SAM-dependent RNA methyltransferase [Anaerolineae bacterium]
MADLPWHYLERYKPVVDDWDAFATAVTKPLPTTIWANPLKTTPEQLEMLLAQSGIRLEPVGWYPGAYRLPAGVKPGLRWEYLAGLYHVQEEVALLPAALLDAQPGERVLDMCAAPGNKTAQISVALQNRGTVVANDRSVGRMRAARQVFDRLGLVNVTALTQDAANLPAEIGQFDKILADVPCTCEGTCRKEPYVLRRASAQRARQMARVQRAILRKAAQLCRPGGRIVYATCTFAPEENELVLDSILREFAGEIRLRPTAAPHFTASPGLTKWDGRNLNPDLVHALRVWPHQNDTGGFFVAVLEKEGNRLSVSGERLSVGEVYSGKIQRQPWLDSLVEHHGFSPELFDELELLRWGKRGVWLVNADHQPPLKPQPDSVGLALLRPSARFPKLGTAAAMYFGPYATRNFMEVTAVQLTAYLARRSFTAVPEQTANCTGTGFIIIRYQGIDVGMALYRREIEEVESLYPKGWARELEI